MLYVFHLCFPTPFNTGEKVVSSHKVDDLYYLCLFSDLTVRSLRDLRGEHVPILKRIQKVVINGLAEEAWSRFLSIAGLCGFDLQNSTVNFWKIPDCIPKKKGDSPTSCRFFFPARCHKGENWWYYLSVSGVLEQSWHVLENMCSDVFYFFPFTVCCSGKKLFLLLPARYTTILRSFIFTFTW